MKHHIFFRRHPVFTRVEMEQYLSSHQDVDSRTVESLLGYHKKAGHLITVRRGLYAVIPNGSTPDRYPIDPFLITAKLTKDAVLSHHTALEIHGNSYSVHERFTYTASRPLSPLTFRNNIFCGVRSPEALRSLKKQNYGVNTVDRSGIDVRVTSLERTMVDVLNRPDISGGWEEIWRSLESVEFFDLDKLVEYVHLLKKATTAAKVGFYLEQHRESLMVEDKYLKSLRELRPKQPHYLKRQKNLSCRLISEWNLVIPTEIIERTWEEIL